MKIAATRLSVEVSKKSASPSCAGSGDGRLGNRWGRVESSREILNNRLHPRVQRSPSLPVYRALLVFARSSAHRTKEETAAARHYTFTKRNCAPQSADPLGDFFMRLVSARARVCLIATYCANTSAGWGRERADSVSPAPYDPA